MIEIGEGIFISEDDFEWRFSRSSGPGGQNVNKVSTRVTLFFDVAGCSALNDAQKRRILTKLRTRADKNGQLRVISQKHRTQAANRNAAIEKLAELISKALIRPKPRKKTKVPYASKQKRLAEKKRRGMLKQYRSKQVEED
jgi:ribosome-associated protein